MCSTSRLDNKLIGFIDKLTTAQIGCYEAEWDDKAVDLCVVRKNINEVIAGLDTIVREYREDNFAISAWETNWDDLPAVH